MRVLFACLLLVAAAQAFVAPRAPAGRALARPSTESSSALNVVKINVGEEEPIDDALKRFKRSV
eukprot:CAMPEP_0118887200 /NCGR_PEP_ID=MMETSP1163-20130328/25011_1 /TAXON_ID=124430 /ORGANISM="Phaeomonas parva, Strain CCMP2877" /LENGTH=63 /DNA_ID=CAMNT_0006825597 /DNA_START=25 /DNA_END=213 /DNA_ORIENTATION=+